MPASIGVNLRVTGHCSQGGRKYMEDLFSVAYQQTEDERDLEYAFFGIYDGHGGSEAAAYAKEHLMDSIVKQRQFWSDNDEDVLKAIRNGYMLTHLNMWKELEKWPKTVTGLPSTAGTTASIAFIRRGKIYIGHVGDSAIVLGYQKDDCEEWAAKPLTCDHKPESTAEIERIQRCGGKVVSKAGVPRVVWNRPRLGHKGPIKKNTPMDEIPFLAVARSLGDLWSYNPHNDEFIVSPDPDVGVLTIDPSKFRCLVFGTDGLWNMISPAGAVRLVQATERHNEAALLGGGAPQPHADWLNPSKSLVDHALERWSNTRMRADNTSVVTLMLDPPGPPRATVLRSRTAHKPANTAPAPTTPTGPHAPAPATPHTPADPEARPVPQNGLTIMTRYSDVDKPAPSPDTPERTPLPPCASLDGRFSLGPQDEPQKDTEDSEDSELMTNYGNPAESYFMARLLNRSKVVNTLSDVYDEIVNGRTSKAGSEVRETSPQATALEAGDADRQKSPEKETRETVIVNEAGDTGDALNKEDVGIQINEVSSSSPTEAPPRPRGRRPKSEAKRESAAAPNDRVLRSHHDSEPPRQTRQGATRGRAAPPPPPPAADRVVILSRRAPQVTVPAVVRVERPPRRAGAAEPPPPGEVDRGRATRSQAAVTQAAQKQTRGLKREGNCARGAEAPARGCKENRGAAPRRPARPACPAPAPPPPPPGVAEVHSTTGEHPRALRSRNDAEAPPPGAKRARCEAAPAGAGAGAGAGGAKAARLAGAGAGAPRALSKRSAAGPWAPALALRNRLRKRLAK